MGIIASITTIPSRYKYFLASLCSIVNQNCVDKIDKIIINLDDTVTKDDLKKYDIDFLSKHCGLKSDKIIVKKRPHEWKSANKFIWTYKEYPNDAIACFDDDGIYDRDCLEQLIQEQTKNNGFIICQQTNSVMIDRERKRVEYLDFIDVKLKQKGFSKYFSHACLFPPNCFSELLFDFDKFQYITEGHHDELWFWIVSTLNGVKSICLDNLGYFYYDYHEEICAEETCGGLGISYNGNTENIKRYNYRLNEIFGKQLFDIIDKNGVEFHVTRENSYSTYMSIGFINQIYNCWNITFIFDKNVSSSWVGCISDSISATKWYGDIKLIKTV